LSVLTDDFGLVEPDDCRDSNRRLHLLSTR